MEIPMYVITYLNMYAHKYLLFLVWGSSRWRQVVPVPTTLLRYYTPRRQPFSSSRVLPVKMYLRLPPRPRHLEGLRYCSSRPAAGAVQDCRFSSRGFVQWWRGKPERYSNHHHILQAINVVCNSERKHSEAVKSGHRPPRRTTPAGWGC
jgi:hypothetical protein